MAVSEIVHGMDILIDIAFESVVGNHHKAVFVTKADTLSSSEITVTMDNLLNSDFINNHTVSELEDPLERIEVEYHQEY